MTVALLKEKDTRIKILNSGLYSIFMRIHIEELVVEVFTVDGMEPESGVPILLRYRVGLLLASGNAPVF